MTAAMPAPALDEHAADRVAPADAEAIRAAVAKRITEQPQPPLTDEQAAFLRRVLGQLGTARREAA